MQASAEDTGVQVTPQGTSSAIERRLGLVVSRLGLERSVDMRLKQMGKRAKIAGFRPGKVPLPVLRQQYGDQAYREALNDALADAFGAAVAAEGLRVAGYPRIEANSTAQDGESLAFSAVFEVFPEISLADFSAVEIKRPILQIGDAEVDKTIAILRNQRVHYEGVQRAAASGDRVVIDFVGRKNGELFEGGQATDYPFVLGQGAMLPDFEQAILGLAAGESKKFDLTFPADYFARDMAGQTVQFEVTLRRVSEPILPEINAEFAKALGVEDGDVAKMRTEITSNLVREVGKRIQNLLKDRVMAALAAAHTAIDVPRALLEREVQQMVENARQEAKRRGISMKDMPIQPEWFVEQAKRRVVVGLVVSELVKKNELKAEPEQLKSVVEEMAMSYQDPEEVVRWYYSQPERLRDVEAKVIEDNVVNWVLTVAKVIDEAVAFDELMAA